MSSPAHVDVVDSSYMTRGTVIRTFFILSSLCLSVWQMPKVLEHLTQNGETNDLLSELVGVPTQGSDALRKPTRAKGSGPILISPAGVTPEQQEQLLAQARRLSPRPMAPQKTKAKVAVTTTEPQLDDPETLERVLELAKILSDKELKDKDSDH